MEVPGKLAKHKTYKAQQRSDVHSLLPPFYLLGEQVACRGFSVQRPATRLF